MTIEPYSATGVHYDETQTDDVIFKDDRNDMGITRTLVTSDNHYHKPDRTTHIFSTMGKGLYCTHRDNTITQIRRKDSMKSLASKDTIGVYIIEKTTMYATADTKLTDIVEYYLDSNVSLDMTTDSARVFIDNIRKKKLQYDYNGILTIRIIRFIPSSVLMEKDSIYVPEADICIHRYIPTAETHHPYSRGGRSSNVVTTYSGKRNTITIDIIDNTNPERRLYMRTGDKVHTFYTRRDTSTPNGITITRTSTKGTIDTFEYESSEMEELGLFSTADDAMCDGDIKKKLELEKLRYEGNKLDVDYKMLAMKYKGELDKLTMTSEENAMKLQHRIEMHKLDGEHSVNDAMLKMQVETHKAGMAHLTNVTKMTDGLHDKMANIKLHSLKHMGAKADNRNKAITAAVTVGKTAVALL